MQNNKQRNDALRGLRYTLIYSVLIVGSLLMIYPFVYGAVAGVMDPIDYLKNATFFPIPRKLVTFDYYIAVLTDIRLLIFARNTFMRIIWQLIFLSFTSVVLGYVFSKLHFKGKNVIFGILLGSMMIPGQATMVPTYVMYARWPLLGGNNIFGQGGHGMLNSWWIFTIPAMLSIYHIFLTKQMFDTLPNEIEEAARIDGAGTLTIIFRIYARLLLPILAVMFLGIFTGCWNDYQTNLLYTDGQSWNLLMISYGIDQIANSFKFSDIINYPAIFATATITTIPSIIVFLCVQRSFVEGLAMSGIKG